MHVAGNDDDPISAASSGLLAIGVAPRRRMETLGLLAALLDLADERGEVLLDSALMETEERLGIDLCLEGYEWLEQLDVIQRTWSGWVIPNFDAHNGPVGATFESLAVVGRHLEHRENVAAVVPLAPVEAPAIRHLTWRRRLPVVAASVAAGVAVLAGATQLVPQAAVTTRNAAVGTNATDNVGTGAVGAVTSLATQATDAVTAATDVTNTGDSAAVTTTTSTTLLPAIPCLSDTIDSLTSRAGLRTKQTGTPLPPGILPCP
jgi:hypothetical protein